MSGSLQFVGNATVLLRWDGLTLLTDPNFLHRGQRAYLGHGLWTTRLTEPALCVEDLPVLDAVVLSHLHGDHFDRVARHGLRRDVPIITTPHAARGLCRRWRYTGTVGLRAGQRHVVSADGASVEIIAVPGQHAPDGVGWLLPPVMGSLLQLRSNGRARPYRIYLTGDTLFTPRIQDALRLLPALDVVVTHLGGTTLPGGLVVTMDGEQGARLVQHLQPQHVVPVHHSDYSVFASPLSEFLRACEDAKVHDRVHVLQPGESFALP